MRRLPRHAPGGFAIALFALGVFVFGVPRVLHVAEAQTPRTREDLESQIKLRSDELQKINQQIFAIQEEVAKTRSERATLQREIQGLQRTAKQLELNIRADELSLQKLGFEIESLTLDIDTIRGSIGDKRAAIEEIFKTLQRKSEVNPVLVVFRSGSLADGVLELESLTRLNSQLALDVTNLKLLREKLSVKVDALQIKKQETDLHQKNLVNRKLIVKDQEKERNQLVAETKNREGAYQERIDALRKVQQEIAEEIEAIDAELRTKIDPSLLPAPRPGVLAYPIQGEIELTQGYGVNSFAVKAYPGKRHNGIDFRAPLGTPVFAAESGAVAVVDDQDKYRGCYRGAYGKYIVINHDENLNLTTLYSHLSRYIVQAGEYVVRGQLIGYSGRSGYATGPHLHFTVFAQPTFYLGQSRVCGEMPYGGDLDPSRYL